MGYIIASFNIQKFGKQSVTQNENGEIRKDLDKIAKIIRDNNFDIIAIQEIYHKEALKELLEKISSQYAEDILKRGNYNIKTANGISSRMNDSFGYRTKHWEGRWAQPKSHYGGNIQEGYAFIWNRDRIQLVTNMKGDSFEPRIADFGEAGKLARPPFIGRFMPINSRYELRLINTHIVYSIPAKRIDEDEDEAEEETKTDKNDYELRRDEFNILARNIFYTYNKQHYDLTGHDKYARNLEWYTFILGDYNLNKEDSNSQTAAYLKKENESITMRSRRNIRLVTVNDDLTTIKGKSRNPEVEKMRRHDPKVENHLSNNYDHFSYDSNMFEDHKIAYPNLNVIYAFDMFANDETEEQSKYDLYRTKISDHLPLCLEFDIRKKM